MICEYAMILIICLKVVGIQTQFISALVIQQPLNWQTVSEEKKELQQNISESLNYK